MQKNKKNKDKYYKDLGFKCGLEIHQQLDTEKKLFCRCKTVLHNEKPDATILRHMRPTLSELGEYDGTALMEFKTKKNVTYELYNDTVCTYEMDDTPPFKLNEQALDIALEIGLMLNCNIVDEIHISRKQYLDGSIPTGFQRTGIIGVEGEIPYKNKKIGIIQLGLEEDACREISDKGHEIIFRTDRLSIPLVEVVTYPDIKTPSEAVEVAELIGRLLRSTAKVRRGLGSTRQDVNVSIKVGTRIELKGISKLQHIKDAVANEAERQKALLEIRDELRSRGISENNFKSDFKDVTNIFNKTKSKKLKHVIKNKDKIYAVVLRGYAGILDKKTQKNKIFSDEISGRIRVIACIDKLPNIIHRSKFEEFGISNKEKDSLEKILNAKIADSIVLVWGNKKDLKTAVEEIKIRAKEAIKGVPSETRQVFKDGTNDFERILPGPDRMYPDTDSPPTAITEKHLKRIKKTLPEKIWLTEKRLTELKIPENLVKKLSISKYLDLFYKIINELGIDPVLVATSLEEKTKYLRRKGKRIDLVSEKNIYDIFKNYKENRFSKEAIPEILSFLSDYPKKDLDDAIKKLDIKALSIDDLNKEIEKVISKDKKRYQNNKQKINAIMGEVMKVARNRIDGEKVRERILKILNS